MHLFVENKYGVENLGSNPMRRMYGDEKILVWYARRETLFYACA